MATSFSTFDNEIYNIVTKLRPSYVLDVGAGAGKIGKIVSKSAKLWKYDCIIIGCEPFLRYIGQYDLKWMYDFILNQDILDLVENLTMKYDLIIFGDSLEHIEKDKALPLLEKLLKICKYIIIVTPDNMKIDEATVEDPIHGRHVSNWGIDDFGNELMFYQSKKHVMKGEPGATIYGTNIPIEIGRVDIMNLFILRGELSTGESDACLSL